MIRQSLRLGLAAALAAPLAMGSAAFAQPAGPPGRPMMGPAMHRGPDQGSPAEREARLAQRLTDILQLRPEQQGALHAFLEATRPDPAMMGGMNAMRDETMTAPQRLDRMLAHVDRLRAAVAARAQATKAFYAQLTAPQQKAFDALAPMLGPMMLMRRGGMMGGFHHREMMMREMGPGGGPQG